MTLRDEGLEPARDAPLQLDPVRRQPEPHEHSPSGVFIAAVEAGNYFNIELFFQGIRKGWLNVDNNYWAVLNSDVPLTLEYYRYDRATYYKIPGQDYYMSISAQAYVGFYKWIGATTFTLTPSGRLLSQHNGQALSFYSSDYQYLTCWDAAPYNVFEPVKLHPYQPSQ
jgi:hypothetical protein